MALYRQGDVNLILNADPNSVARTHFVDHGPSVRAIGSAALRQPRPVPAVEAALRR